MNKPRFGSQPKCVALVIGLGLATVAWGQVAARDVPGGPSEQPGIGNFGQVNDRLLRGSQPTKEGIDTLKKLGVRIIVSFRQEDEEGAESERALVERRGMRFVGIPISGLGAPSHEQVAEFFDVFKQNPETKVFVHCRRGAERTGTMIAAYRIAFEGWIPERALEEMKSFHFAHSLYPQLVSFVRGFPRFLREHPDLAAPVKKD
jgi:protein tyrosine phosphatase (PTP) superfamily phosphohydrolase (DUF442 family)